jgi:protoporphyrinogen oxidase
LINSIGENEWNFWGGNQKDIAGLFLNNKMQRYSPYVDMRNFDIGLQKKALADFFFNLQGNIQENKSNALDYLSTRFGHTIAQDVFTPILHKFYQTDPLELDVLATKLITATDRVIFFDEDQMTDLMKSDLIRSKLAFPEQINLPLAYRSTSQHSLYPKKFGMFRVVEGFKKNLVSLGVKFILDSTITSIVEENNNIVKISVKRGNEEIVIDNIDLLIWSAGIIPLASTLKLDFKLPVTLKKAPTYYVNMMFNKKVNMDNLYYLYCYQPEFSTFRITNYSNYCPNAYSSDYGYPVCVEFWPNSAEVLSEDQIKQDVMKELTTFGVIDESHKMNFFKAEIAHGGFPTPTIETTKVINSIRHSIKNKEIKNLINIGILAEEDVFFFKDVLIDSFNKINERI